MADFFRSIFGLGSLKPTDPNDVRSTFLFTEPSFLTGAGRIFDLWGGFDIYYISRSPAEADLRALYADWRVIGQDFRDVMHTEAAELALAEEAELELV
jgi:hypothetical protein